MMNKSQADVAYGFVGIRRSDPGLHGDVGDEQRARPVRDWRPARRQHPRAAGHGVLRVQLAGRDVRPGPFSIRAGVSAANVEKTIASIDAELTACSTKGFTEQEIDESKSYMIGSIPRQLETNAAIASFLLSVDTFGLGMDYDERLPGLIGAMTKDTADAAARRLLDPARAGRRRRSMESAFALE